MNESCRPRCLGVLTRLVLVLILSLCYYQRTVELGPRVTNRWRESFLIYQTAREGLTEEQKSQVLDRERVGESQRGEKAAKSIESKKLGASGHDSNPFESEIMLGDKDYLETVNKEFFLYVNKKESIPMTMVRFPKKTAVYSKQYYRLNWDFDFGRKYVKELAYFSPEVFYLFTSAKMREDYFATFTPELEELIFQMGEVEGCNEKQDFFALITDESGVKKSTSSEIFLGRERFRYLKKFRWSRRFEKEYGDLRGFARINEKRDSYEELTSEDTERMGRVVLIELRKYREKYDSRFEREERKTCDSGAYVEHRIPKLFGQDLYLNSGSDIGYSSVWRGKNVELDLMLNKRVMERMRDGGNLEWMKLKMGAISKEKIVEDGKLVRKFFSEEVLSNMVMYLDKEMLKAEGRKQDELNKANKRRLEEEKWDGEGSQSSERSGGVGEEESVKVDDLKSGSEKKAGKDKKVELAEGKIEKRGGESDKMEPRKLNGASYSKQKMKYIKKSEVHIFSAETEQIYHWINSSPGSKFEGDSHKKKLENLIEFTNKYLDKGAFEKVSNYFCSFTKEIENESIWSTSRVKVSEYLITELDSYLNSRFLNLLFAYELTESDSETTRESVKTAIKDYLYILLDAEVRRNLKDRIIPESILHSRILREEFSKKNNEEWLNDNFFDRSRLEKKDLARYTLFRRLYRHYLESYEYVDDLGVFEYYAVYWSLEPVLDEFLDEYMDTVLKMVYPEVDVGKMTKEEEGKYVADLMVNRVGPVVKAVRPNASEGYKLLQDVRHNKCPFMLLNNRVDDGIALGLKVGGLEEYDEKERKEEERRERRGKRQFEMWMLRTAEKENLAEEARSEKSEMKEREMEGEKKKKEEEAKRKRPVAIKGDNLEKVDRDEGGESPAERGLKDIVGKDRSVGRRKRKKKKKLINRLKFEISKLVRPSDFDWMGSSGKCMKQKLSI